MTYPIVFGNLAAGNQPASQFDTMFNVAGQQGNIPCTVSGTNTLTATPQTNYYLPAAYTNGQIISFKAVATSTGSCTIQIGGLALVNLYTAAGIQAAAGDIVINNHYACQYWSDLNTGAGGFIILNATTTAIANPIQGGFKNLNITVTSNTQLTLTADAVVLQNVSGGTVRVLTPSLTINTGTSGANGLDTGSIAQGFYNVFVIFNPTTVTTAGLLSLSATSPTLPSGYTYFARYGVVRTDASPFLYRSAQLGRMAQYLVTPATNTATVIILSNGVTGTYSSTSPTLASVTVVNVVIPVTASSIQLMVTNNWKAGSASNVLVAPTANYGGTNNGPTGSNGQVYPIWQLSTANRSDYCSIRLEGQLGIAMDAAGGAVAVLGWEDNI